MRLGLAVVVVAILGMGYYIFSSPYRMHRVEMWVDSHQELPSEVSHESR